MSKAEHKRVADAIGEAILTFCRESLEAVWPIFHMDELREYVEGKVGTVAPDSPGRILRSLRQRGLVDYYVSNRAKSEYTIRSVAEKGKHA